MVQKKAFNGISTYEYDKRGNRVLETSEHTQENRRTMEWDAANHLVKGTRGPDYGLYKSEYTYNGLGIRVNSTIEGPEHTVYDRDYIIDYIGAEHNDLVEYNVGHYQWQGTKKVHELKYLYTADGQRLEVDALVYSQWGGENTKYSLNIHEDVMGSATGYTYQGGPNDGQWANKHEYDVWGYNSKSPTYNYDPMYRSTEPYYTGHQFDGSLNIYYADARFYDAETGTWLSPDPIKDGLNWYTYCGSNPTSYLDYNGQLGRLIGAGIGALAGAIIGGGMTIIEGIIKDDPPKIGEIVGNALIGAGSGAYIGSGFGIKKAAVKVVHWISSAEIVGAGLMDGLMTQVTGGNFSNGFSGGLIAGNFMSKNLNRSGLIVSSLYVDLMNAYHDDRLDNQHMGNIIANSAVNIALSAIFSKTLGAVPQIIKGVPASTLGDDLLTVAPDIFGKHIWKTMFDIPIPALFEVIKYGASETVDIFFNRNESVKIDIKDGDSTMNRFNFIKNKQI